MGDTTPSGPESRPPEASQPPPRAPEVGDTFLPAREAEVPEPGRPVVLQEMGLGEILDTAIRLYRTNWRTLMGVVAIVMVPFIFMQTFIGDLTTPQFNPFAFDPEAEVPEATPGFSGLGLLLTAVEYLIVLPFITAAVARAAADVYLGEIPTVGTTYRFALSRIGSILWVSILYGFVVAGGSILLLIPGIYFFVALVFSPAAVVIEGARGVEALKRSRALSKGHWWKIFGTLILAYLLVSVLSVVFVMPFWIASFFAGPVGWILVAIGSSIGNVLLVPFLTVIVILLYFDMRIRREGFDLSLMARELEPPRI